MSREGAKTAPSWSDLAKFSLWMGRRLPAATSNAQELVAFVWLADTCVLATRLRDSVSLTRCLFRLGGR